MARLLLLVVAASAGFVATASVAEAKPIGRVRAYAGWYRVLKRSGAVRTPLRAALWNNGVRTTLGRIARSSGRMTVEPAHAISATDRRGQTHRLAVGLGPGASKPIPLRRAIVYTRTDPRGPGMVITQSLANGRVDARLVLPSK